MSTGNGNDTDVRAMQAELRELRARVRTLEAEKRRPTLEGHGARVQAIAAEAAALQPLKEAAAATAPASAGRACARTERAIGVHEGQSHVQKAVRGLRELAGRPGQPARRPGHPPAGLVGGAGARRVTRRRVRGAAKDRRHARALFGGNEARAQLGALRDAADALRATRQRQGRLAGCRGRGRRGVRRVPRGGAGRLKGSSKDVWRLGDAYERKPARAAPRRRPTRTRAPT